MTTRTRRAGRKVWANLAVVSLVALVASSTYFFTTNHHLAVENRNRIAEIQQSRVDSCKQTYEGIREVFQPFLPGPNDPQTDKQRHDIALFNKTVDRLKAKCETQTKTKGAS